MDLEFSKMNVTYFFETLRAQQHSVTSLKTRIPNKQTRKLWKKLALEDFEGDGSLWN